MSDTLVDIQEEIYKRCSELKIAGGTYIKSVFDYPELAPEEFPAISLGYPQDPELGERRTTARETRVIDFPIYLIVPHTKDSAGHKSLLNAIDQVRSAFRIKGMRDTLNGKCNINKGVTRVVVDEVRSTNEFIVYMFVLTLVVFEPLG